MIVHRDPAEGRTLRVLVWISIVLAVATDAAYIALLPGTWPRSRTSRATSP